MAPKSLLVLYRDPVPILNASRRQYRTGVIDRSRCPLRFRRVEDSIQLIFQALTALGTRDPRFKIQGELETRFLFQYHCHRKQDFPPSQVKTTPLQFLRHISIVSNASGNPLLQGECSIIIILYFFLLHLEYYTGFKSESTPFCLEDVAFSCGRSIFAATSIKEVLK